MKKIFCPRFVALVATSLLACLVVPGLAAKDKMKPEELVARHLESVGTAEARAAAGSRVVTGTVATTVRLGGSGQAQGEARLVSDGPRSAFNMVFGLSDYPHERVAFDGKDVTTSQLNPGSRSRLGSFLYTYRGLVRQGILTGTLSAAWPLLDVTAGNPRITYAGTKKVDGRVIHELRFRPRKDSTDVQTSFFFEDGTFRHERTEYRLVMSASIGTRPEASVDQQETRYTLSEEFSDFRAENNLTLPHAYVLKYTFEGQASTFSQEWSFQLTQFVFGQPIDAREFNATAE